MIEVITNVSLATRPEPQPRRSDCRWCRLPPASCRRKAVTGHSLWLPCTGQGNPPPTLHWVLPDGSALQTNRPAPDPRVAMYDNGTLHYKDLTLTDNGKYECIATSSTGSEWRVVTVTVEKRDSAPWIVETSQLMTELSFGDQLRLNCLATGEPKPRIMWRLPSEAVVDQWHR